MRTVKIQVYLPSEELTALRRVAKWRRRPVADLVREAVWRVWLHESSGGPVGVITGPLPCSSDEHDNAFDSI